MRTWPISQTVQQCKLLLILVTVVDRTNCTNAFVPSPSTLVKSSSTSPILFLFDFLKPKEEESGMKNIVPEDVPEQQQQQQQGNFSDDPVDKIFGFFFGQKEEAPMGMKRFGRGASSRVNSNI
jgi:hypothetical protein